MKSIWRNSCLLDSRYHLSMFYLFAIGSMVAYAFQNTLLVHHARKIDGLSLAAYRNLSFIVTLLPLLFLSPAAHILTILSHWRLLIVSGVTGGISLGLLFSSYKFLSTSFSSALVISTSTISTTCLGWWYLGERIPVHTLLFIMVILSGVLGFGLQYKRITHLDRRLLLGILLAALNGPFVAYSKYLAAVLARATDPLAVGYFWEVSIGISSFFLLLLRQLLLKKKMQRITPKTLAVIAACGSPTLLGTGLFTLAAANGPIAIVSAIGGGALVVATLLAWGWYGEKITLKQSLAISVIVLGILGLKTFKL